MNGQGREKGAGCFARYREGTRGGQSCGNKISTGSGQLLGVVLGIDVEGYAGNFEDFRPPPDELEPALASRISAGNEIGDAETDVVGASFPESHGGIARAAGITTDDTAAPQQVSGLFIVGKARFRRYVDSIGPEIAGKSGIPENERGRTRLLREIDERLATIGP